MPLSPKIIEAVGILTSSMPEDDRAAFKAELRELAEKGTPVPLGEILKRITQKKTLEEQVEITQKIIDLIISEKEMVAAEALLELNPKGGSKRYKRKRTRRLLKK